MKLFRIWLAYNRLALPSVLLVSVWALAVSFPAYSSNLFFPHFGGKGGGGGAYFLSFFFADYTENAVVLTSGLSVLLASNAVLFWYAAIRMHCETTGVWFKGVCPMLGVVIVEWKSSWVIQAECWSFCSFKRSCLWLKPSTFCCALGKKMLFCSLLVGGWGGHWSL